MRTLHLAIATASLLASVALLPAASAISQSTHDPTRWHPPSAGHEHGDPPPAWLADFYAQYGATVAPYWGDDVLYDGSFNTSPIENTAKHFAFKGVHLTYPEFQDRDGGWLDGYVVGHVSGTPADRGAMVHSFRAYIADAGGGLTIRQGWVNMGSPETARVPRRCALNPPGGSDCADFGSPDQRPIALVITPDDAVGTYSGGRPETFEQWYGFGAGFSWAWGLNTPTFFRDGEHATDTDPSGWHPVGGLAHGQLRLIEVIAGKPSFPIPSGGLYFWTTPDGSRVDNPASTECLGHCLLQAISPTYRGITGRIQRTWPLPSPVNIAN